METSVVILSDVGSRLRSERERLRLNQEDFGGLAGVTRNSQQTYEAGKRPFTVSYLLALKEHSVDIVYVLDGQRSAKGLSDNQARIVSAFDALDTSNQTALLQLVCSLSGQPAPAASFNLPSAAALEDAMSGLLDQREHWTPDAIVHEIANTLPRILRSAEHAIDGQQSDQLGTGRELGAVRHANLPSIQQEKRT